MGIALVKVSSYFLIVIIGKHWLYYLLLDVLRSDYCKFTSSWLSDDVNLDLEDDLDLVDIALEATREILLKLLISICAIILSIAFLIRTLWRKN